MAGDEYSLLVFENYEEYDNFVLSRKYKVIKDIMLPRREYTMFCLSDFKYKGEDDNRLYRISENLESIRIWDLETIQEIKDELDQETLTQKEKEDKERSIEMLDELTEYLKNDFIVCFYTSYD